MKTDWHQDLPFAITVCDLNGIIIYMNEMSITTFEKYGGKKLIGTDLAHCHPEPSKSKLKELLKSGKKNVYTIEKNGIRKMIYQSPWYKDGVFSGLIEISLPLPAAEEMPHFVRN
ncbi:MAG: diguanylate cyclase [Oligoflexia bacterium]|nr:diguanylate cyclase [Oligoflexia bacterium]MBF0365240.1 diguanylate cyclase [Oligoflexia bacterium]